MAMSTHDKVSALRKWMQHHHIDAIIVPREDEFLGEYVPAYNERLAWLTGFTGSAGAAVIGVEDQAGIFVDGRYTVQVKQQVPNDLFSYQHLIETPVLSWINAQFAKGSTIAIDPKLHSFAWLQQAQSKLSNMTLKLLDSNAIDPLWQDRPTQTLTPLFVMPLEYCGQTSYDKRQQLAAQLQQQDIDAVVITALDSISWLLNIRARDISRLPVALCHAIADSQGRVTLFIDRDRVSDECIAHWGEGVQIVEPQQLQQYLQNFSNQNVQLDANSANAWFALHLQNAGAQIINQKDPCSLPKACKNDTEIKGMRACHIRDGVAMVRFLAWLDNEVTAGRLHDEATLADQLLSYRQQDERFVDISFDTISAAGSNAAMCHYNHKNQPAPKTLTLNSLYLVDSGGQYRDGTTDITRTVAIGQPTDDMKRMFTLVLKGHINIATARFPKGTCGYQLDSFARQPLWQQGYDFDHGTGHGVGHFLNVHEGPQNLSKRPVEVALQPGMIVSNEPGYYQDGGFGIRIENLELVTPVMTQGDRESYGFSSLTRCPIDLRCIDTTLLTETEIQWLNHYHQQVRDALLPLVEGDLAEWLTHATRPLVRSR
ncbi:MULTISPECIES: aminopeptidase P family protein [unclassified Vibrio]|uniref:Aminopeptidase P family protein n=1 Tax=Vibrio sp. HB236076 TaxID=3232307 RepID=A0AB39HGL8_9VIBR|nr:aminopeptidase P family protein [Vibrio sp. HB161653]MDP5255823.1 aminopeptidase P family protein [Vibrio sp. HB161653]